RLHHNLPFGPLDAFRFQIHSHIALTFTATVMALPLSHYVLKSVNKVTLSHSLRCHATVKVGGFTLS
ncbi:MAG: hypothetical protein L0K39_02850, partial [Enterobacterales bacterium]|nr:hypothetical protein [Enterobacterales bacterium]